MLITIKEVFNFFFQIKTQGKSNTKLKLFQGHSSTMCGVSRTWVFSYIDKPFLPHLGQFSNCLSNFTHSYLSQMTIKK